MRMSIMFMIGCPKRGILKHPTIIMARNTMRARNLLLIERRATTTSNKTSNVSVTKNSLR